MNNIQQFTIDYRRWIHGNSKFSEINSCLLREDDGKMCCLGFYALANGVRPDKILGVGDLALAKEYIVCNRHRDDIEESWLTESAENFDSAFYNNLIYANDSRGNIAEKIVYITNSFKKEKNIDVKFVNVPKNIREEVDRLRAAA